MACRILFCLISQLTLIMGLATAAPPLDAEYKISWQDSSPNIISIEAELPITGGYVTMSDQWASFFDNPRGWAQFVTVKQATSSDGEALEFEVAAPYGWTVGENFNGRAQIKYEVDFSFGSKQWDVGNEQVALLLDKSLYMTGMPLFLHAKEQQGATITFNVAADTKVAAAWPEKSGKFHAKSLVDLLLNAVAIGEFFQATMSVDGAELQIAMLGDLQGHGEQVATVAKRITPFFSRLAGSEKDSHYLMVFLPGANDGEGYQNSFVSTQPELKPLKNGYTWMNSMAHEYFHVWNGGRLFSTAEDETATEWFSEGFTEYVANLALLETGLIDPDLYDEILSQYLSYHAFFIISPKYSDMTIRSAGENNWANRPGVYDSGVVAAFCVDSLIRERSNGRENIGRVFTELSQRTEGSNGEYRFADLIDAITAAVGNDMKPFFDRHIDGKHSLPMKICSARMGYEVTAEGYHYLLSRPD